MFKKLIAVSVIITFIAACDAINPFSPKTTHTMEEVVKDAKGLYYYEGDTITLKATVESMHTWESSRYVEWGSGLTEADGSLEADGYLKLRTYDPDVEFTVYFNGLNKEYEADKTYTLTVTIKAYDSYSESRWLNPQLFIYSHLVED